MIVVKYCRLLGMEREMDLPITEDQLLRWQAGGLVQEVFPNLSADQREFLITGLLPGEFEKAISGKLFAK